MAETVSFKVCLKELESEGKAEVRRFVMDKDASTSFTYLMGKLSTVFPHLKNYIFTVNWTDEDGDKVTIATDEELIIALTEMKGPLYKIQVLIKGGKGQEEAKNLGNMSGEVHPNVTCGDCGKPVVGFRYKCMVCETTKLILLDSLLQEKMDSSEIQLLTSPEIKTESSNSVFKCGFCGKCFVFENTLQNHILNNHGGDQSTKLEATYPPKSVKITNMLVTKRSVDRSLVKRKKRKKMRKKNDPKIRPPEPNVDDESSLDTLFGMFGRGTPVVEQQEQRLEPQTLDLSRDSETKNKICQSVDLTRESEILRNQNVTTPCRNIFEADQNAPGNSEIKKDDDDQIENDKENNIPCVEMIEFESDPILVIDEDDKTCKVDIDKAYNIRTDNQSDNLKKIKSKAKNEPGQLSNQQLKQNKNRTKDLPKKLCSPQKRVRKFTCKECSGEFKRNIDLKRHKEQVHASHPTKWKRLQCAQCSFSTYNNDLYWSHVLVEHNINDRHRFFCGNPACWFPFQTLNEKRSHEREKHGGIAKNFKCDLCQRSFEKGKMFKYHRKKCLKRPLYRCPFCLFQFKKFQSLGKHTQSKHQQDILSIDKSRYVFHLHEQPKLECKEVSANTEDEGVESSEDLFVTSQDVCLICDSTKGALIGCIKCRTRFHQYCIGPAENAGPEDLNSNWKYWKCPMCIGPRSALSGSSSQQGECKGEIIKEDVVDEGDKEVIHEDVLNEIDEIRGEIVAERDDQKEDIVVEEYEKEVIQNVAEEKGDKELSTEMGISVLKKSICTGDIKDKVVVVTGNGAVDETESETDVIILSDGDADAEKHKVPFDQRIRHFSTSSTIIERNGKKVFICPFDEKTFLNRSILHRHFHVVHLDYGTDMADCPLGIDKFSCICGRVTNCRQSFVVHANRCNVNLGIKASPSMKEDREESMHLVSFHRLTHQRRIKRKLKALGRGKATLNEKHAEEARAKKMCNILVRARTLDMTGSSGEKLRSQERSKIIDKSLIKKNIIFSDEASKNGGKESASPRKRHLMFSGETSESGGKESVSPRKKEMVVFSGNTSTNHGNESIDQSEEMSTSQNERENEKCGESQTHCCWKFMDDGAPKVDCDNCKKKFHFKCIGWDEAQVKHRKDDPYVCQACTRQNQALAIEEDEIEEIIQADDEIENRVIPGVTRKSFKKNYLARVNKRNKKMGQLKKPTKAICNKAKQIKKRKRKRRGRAVSDEEEIKATSQSFPTQPDTEKMRCDVCRKFYFSNEIMDHFCGVEFNACVPDDDPENETIDLSSSDEVVILDDEDDEIVAPIKSNTETLDYLQNGAMDSNNKMNMGNLSSATRHDFSPITISAPELNFHMTLGPLPSLPGGHHQGSIEVPKPGSSRTRGKLKSKGRKGYKPTKKKYGLK